MNTEEARVLKKQQLWHVELAIAAAIVLQLLLANQLTIGPKYLVAVMELFLLVGLRLTMRATHDRASRIRRIIGLTLTGLVSITNIGSLILVCHALINGTGDLNGKHLLVSAVSIYITNIILFGLWYWQLDGGGPGGRGTHRPPVDFLFPQMNTPARITEEPNWQPTFFDYVYVSVTNATAFSPTDAMPLTHRAKLLMSIQALASLSTVALVAARAVNILVS